MTAYWITGDARAVMAALPAGSVDLVLTSPPFLALRSYLPDDDPAKVDEIGSEANPAEFIDTLLDITEACARLLAPHGTLAVELGDTYSGSGGAGGDYAENGQQAFSGSSAKRRRDGIGDEYRPSRAGRGTGWPLDKSLSLIPESYRMALAYGRNPHNGRPTDPWRIRNVIRWVRPNPPVGALGDKFRPATSEMVMACKAKDRWFDLDAVRTPLSAKTLTVADGSPSGHHRQTRLNNETGAPPLDWWQISPGGYSGAHYAVFPPELCIKPIEAMCPRRVCRTCHKPSRRTVDLESHGEWRRDDTPSAVNHGGPGTHGHRTRQAETVGWSTCGCPGSDGIRLDGYHTGPGWRPGIVLDPFGGSGTTASVASGHSRDSISIDLDHRNADLARDRIGMWFLEVTPADLGRAA